MKHPSTTIEAGRAERQRSRPSLRGRGTRVAVLVGVLIGVVIGTGSAGAHATLQLYGSDATVEAYGHMFLRIPHGCDGGQATDSVEIAIPAGFTSVRPERKDGWRTRITRNTKGRITAITWYGGNLPDDHFEDFGLSVKYPAKPGTYHLATVQRCGSAIVEWDQVAKPGDDPHALEHPAPSITVNDDGHDTKGLGTKTGKTGAKAIGKAIGKLSEKELAGPGRGEVEALAFNGRITVIADLPANLRGRVARIVVEQGGTGSTLGLVRLDQAGDLVEGYPLAQSGPGGWRISHGDVISVTVDGREVGRVTVETKK